MSDVPQDLKAFLEWANAAIEESDGFLRSQEGYDKFDEAIAALNGEIRTDITTGLLGGPTYNHFGKVALDLVATQTDIKPFWDYSTKNERFQAQAQLANKLAEAWWMGRHVSLEFSNIVKHAMPMGTGYAHMIYNPLNNGFGGGYQGGDIEMMAEDPRDVLPIRPSSLPSIQGAAGVMIRREQPVNWIRGRYGDAAANVKADRDGTLAQLNQNTRFQRLMVDIGLRSGFMDNLLSGLSGMLGRPKAKSLKIPTADLFTLYINDSSINTTGSGTWMGLDDKGEKTNWSYYVPSVGELNKQKGKAFTDSDDEVKLYPRKRCVIFTRTARIYDNTSIYWHGMFPIVKLTLDPWPGLWFGKAPLKDLLPLHKEMQKVMRVMSRHLDRIKRPGIVADKNAIGEKGLKAIDPEMPGLKLRTNPVNGKPVEMLYEPALDAFVERYFLLLKNGMEELSGSAQAAAVLAELNQVPNLDTVDRLISLMGAANRLRSFVVEAFMSEFAMMLLMNFFQFYTQAQRIAILGTQGQTFEDFDFDPGNLIPSDIGEPMPDGSPAPRGLRAREFFKYFTYQVAPGSMLNSASVQDKLMYLTLARAGIIDIATLLEKLNIPNVGLPPDLPSGILQRLQWQQQMGIGMAVSPQGRKASGEQQPRIKMSESG